MERFGGSLPVKGYNSDVAGKKRVQLPGDQGKAYGSYDSSSLFHSTPKNKPLVSSFSTISPTNYKPRTSNVSFQPSNSPARMHRSKSPLHSTSPSRRSTSPSMHRTTSPRLHNSSHSPGNKQLSDVDSDTIQRQRRELQLLIGELKDRDRELNDMVQAHQKQIIAWEEDRQRVFAFEKRSARLESELKKRNEQLKATQARLKASETEEKNKGKELEDTQLQLQHVSEHANTSLHQVQELEEKNGALTSSMREFSNTIGQLQAREQELATKLKLKDNDIMEANVSLGEMQQKIKRLEGLCQELRKTESSLRTERDQWRDQALGNKHEVEKLRGDISKQFSDADEIQAELAKTKQEILVFQKELFLSGEREKRKDQLLELQKSKQERTDSELQNLRQICERQQRDISYMQLQLQSSHDILSKHQTNISEVEVNHQDEEKKPNLYDPMSYILNGDYLDTQDQASIKSLDFDGPLGSKEIDGGELAAYIPAGERAVSSLSLHATAGSDLADDFDNLSQDPLQPPVSLDRGFTSSNMETFLPSRNPSYSTPSTRPDMYPPLGNLTISMGRQEDPNNFATFPAGLRPVELNSVMTPRSGDAFSSYSQAVSTTRTTPPKAQAEGDDSPTSKLHRLLAESRQMVQNLEQSPAFSPSGSPKQDTAVPTNDQFTPPQRHLGSPLHSRPLPSSAE